MTEYPLRVRLAGGRNIHDARLADDGIGHMTACAIYLSPGAQNDWRPDGVLVRCRRCARRHAKATP